MQTGEFKLEPDPIPKMNDILLEPFGKTIGA